MAASVNIPYLDHGPMPFTYDHKWTVEHFLIQNRLKNRVLFANGDYVSDTTLLSSVLSFPDLCLKNRKFTKIIH